QLQAFREKLGAWGTVKTIWMSATLRLEWLETIDFKDKVYALTYCKLEDDDRKVAALRKRLEAKKPIERAGAFAGDIPEEIAKIATLVKEKHRKGSLTLVVVNTVDRAKKLYDAISKPDQQPERRGG